MFPSDGRLYLPEEDCVRNDAQRRLVSAGRRRRTSMNSMRISVHIGAIAVLLWAADARAQTPPWSVSLDFGVQVALTGAVVRDIVPVTVSRSYDDVYGNGFH